MYLLTYVLTYICTYLLMYLLSYLPTPFLLTYYRLTYLCTYIHMYLLTYLPTHLCNYLLTYLLTYVPRYLHTYLAMYLSAKTDRMTLALLQDALSRHSDADADVGSNVEKRVERFWCLKIVISTQVMMVGSKLCDQIWWNVNTWRKFWASLANYWVLI